MYHLNAEEEPEHPDYFKNPQLKKQFGPRGVIHSFADGKIEDTGPLTRKRMETIDEEVTTAAIQFMERAVKADKPFLFWWNATRMHIWTHLKPSSQGVTGLGVYADGMVEHDGMVVQLLDTLDRLGVAALRYDNWKITFLKQNAERIDVWWEPFEVLRAPMLANLRMDPFERAEYESIGYNKWWIDHMFVFAPGGAYVGKWLQSFKEFPPRQKPGSFNLEKVMDAIARGAGDK